MRSLDAVVMAKLGIFLKTAKDTKAFCDLAQEVYETRLGSELDRLGRAGEIELFGLDDSDEEMREWYLRNQTACDALLDRCYQEILDEIVRDKDKMPGVVHEIPTAVYCIPITELTDADWQCIVKLRNAGVEVIGEILDHQHLKKVPNLSVEEQDDLWNVLVRLIWYADF